MGEEWKIGLGNLPTWEFPHHFTIILGQLLKKSIAALKSWLMIINQARIMIHPDHLLGDEFANSVAL